MIVEGKEADDGSVRSFIIRTESGRTTIRNSRHIKFQASKRVSFSEFASDSGVFTKCRYVFTVCK